MSFLCVLCMGFMGVFYVLCFMTFYVLWRSLTCSLMNGFYVFAYECFMPSFMRVFYGVLCVCFIRVFYTFYI